MQKNKVYDKDPFFKRMEEDFWALTFEDVELRDRYSEVGPEDVSVTSYFSRRVPLLSPIVSAAMDTITEAPMAIAMAMFGGLGVIHRGLTPKEQTQEVRKVKRHVQGLIRRPVSVRLNTAIRQVEELRRSGRHHFHTFPVTGKNRELLGFLTRNDFDFSRDTDRVGDAMTPFEELITAPEGTSIEAAYLIMQESRKKVLPLLKEGTRELVGMYLFSDIKRALFGTSFFNVDEEERLRVGAAIGTGPEEIDRAELLCQEGCDVIVIDTAHADSKNVHTTLKNLHSALRGGRADIVVGNISEFSAVEYLLKYADGIKVGQGVGSICSTTEVTGVGCAQLTAIYNCALATRGSGVPICADGGIKGSHHIARAIGAGADCVMVGGLIGATAETPGEIKETKQGRMKLIRGMGSQGAMESTKAAMRRASQKRYRVSSRGKTTPEGVQKDIPYGGEVTPILLGCQGGLKAALAYVGAKDIDGLQERAQFRRLTEAGKAEARPNI